ncbi:dynein axonemal assembly factor 6 isoform 2-T2 [Liasis olivaceus]
MASAARAPLPADSLLALAELLSSAPGDGGDGDGDTAARPAGGRAGPGSIGPPRAGGAAAAPPPTPGDGKAIWSAEEVPEGSERGDPCDPREQPEYVPRPFPSEKRPRRLVGAPSSAPGNPHRLLGAREETFVCSLLNAGERSGLMRAKTPRGPPENDRCCPGPGGGGGGEAPPEQDLPLFCSRIKHWPPRRRAPAFPVGLGVVVARRIERKFLPSRKKHKPL